MPLKIQSYNLSNPKRKSHVYEVLNLTLRVSFRRRGWLGHAEPVIDQGKADVASICLCVCVCVCFPGVWSIFSCVCVCVHEIQTLIYIYIYV